MSFTPRLVHVTTTDISIDWLLSPQLQAFMDEGFDVTTVSAPGPHVAAIKDAGIRHVPVRSFTRSIDPLADLRAARELATVLGDVEPHILHTHNPKPGLIGRLIGHRRGVPVVVNTVHGLYAQPTDRVRRKAAVYGAEALALRFSDMELVQNIEDVVKLRQLGAPRNKLLHLGNGVDLNRFSRTPSNRARGMRLRRSLDIAPASIVIGTVARLVWEKGYGELFDAVEDLKRAGYNDIKVLVVGPMEPGKTGAVDVATIDRMRSLGVTFLGQRNDVEAVYSALDLFVLPSHREGVPRAAMEASAMGVPVIATNIRGCRQVVDDGVTGLLVPVGRSRALARAIVQLATAPGTRSAMSQAAVRRAHKHFDQNRVIDLTLGVYKRQMQAAGIVSGQPETVINLRYSDSISLVDAAESNETEASRAA